MPVRIRLVPGVAPEALLDGNRPGANLQLDDQLIEKDGGRMVITCTLKGHPDEVRGWLSQVARSSEVESAGEA
jgi:hypothetical protein